MRTITGRSLAVQSRWRSPLLLLGLLGVLLILYWPAASLQGVFFVGDIYRLGYPARLEYALALREGRIPLWTTYALAGYPVLAEGQTGAYYPLNLLLYRWLPLPAALNYSILLSIWIAGAGLFAYVRRLGLRRAPAFLAGCIFMLGGFIPSHLNHLNMLTAVAWVPLMLWAVDWAAEHGDWRAWSFLALLFGLQGLAGHPQVSLLAALLVVAQAALGFAPPYGRATGSPLPGVTIRRRIVQVAYCGGALVLGAALAAVQWAPTYELTRLSQRGQGLDSKFFTSFSLDPRHWVTMLWPFIRGNPYPLTSLETIGYVGILPLVLAALAPFRRRDRLVWFWAAVGMAALFLTLGRLNPVYRLLLHVPLLNMFRAPARYLLWLDLAVAVLAAVTADALLAKTREGAVSIRGLLSPVGSLALLSLAGAGVASIPVESLVSWWRWLPLVWLAASAALLFALRRWPPARLWSAWLIGLLLVDLSAFNGVYNQTYNALMPPADFQRPPAALDWLREDAGSEPYRIYTKEEIVPVLPVMRESLYPNIQLLHGIESLNGYYPLIPTAQQQLLGNPNARLIDLLNVRYVLIPQLLPVDEKTEAYDTEDPFAPTIVGRAFDIPQQPVATLEVEGYLSHAADLPDGTPVGEIILHGSQDEEITWTLQAGFDLAEWAYARDDVQKIVRHRQPQIVRVWPARSGFPPRDHSGQTYLAQYALPKTFQVVRLEVRPLIPQAYLRLERLRLIDSTGKASLLADLVGQGDHVLVYRSEDVVIYRNEKAGLRAFLVHRTYLANSPAEAEQRLAAPDFKPDEEAVLSAGRELQGTPLAGDRVVIEARKPEYIRLRASTAADAYLLLGDSDYPGWTARLDGQPVPIRAADIALRAVEVPPGEHVIEFTFAPASWRLGAISSVLAGVFTAIVALCYWRGVGRR